MLSDPLLSSADSKRAQDEIILTSRKRRGGAAFFTLETLSGRAVKSIMLLFYVSIAFAFFTKLFSERVVEIKNVCKNGAGGRFLDTWNSSICQTQYEQGDTIPLLTQTGYQNLTCPSELCLKWDGQIPALSVIDKMVFIAFIVEIGVVENSTDTEFELQFAGHSFDEDDGQENLKPFPPSIFGKRNSSTNPYEEFRVKCKKGQKCDVIMFPEPFYKTNKHRTVQIVLLNLGTVLPYLDVDPSSPLEFIGVAYVFNYWAETLLELIVRYGGLLFVAYLVVMYLYKLGFVSFFYMKPHFREPGSRRSKPWMPEQKATFVVLIFSVLYLNPGKLPTLYHHYENGLTLDGPGWSWNDRVLNFFDTNLPFYYINMLRMYEVLLLACCLRQAPKFSIRLDKRSWPYFFTFSWFAVFLLQDWILLASDLKGYYIGARTRSVWLVSGSIPYMVLVVVWGIVMFGVFIGCCLSLIEKPYWDTKSRQLSFRFFFVFYVWHVVYGIASFVYCWYKYQVGRLVTDELVCGQILMGHNAGDTLSNIVFILLLALFYAPVVFKTGKVPPIATNREWVRLKWPTSWIDYVNSAGNSTMYFFLRESERREYTEAQEASRAPHTRSPLALSRSKLTKAFKRMNRRRISLSTRLEISLSNMSKRGALNDLHQTTSSDAIGSCPTPTGVVSPCMSSTEVSSDDEEEATVKPLFSLELAVDLMCLSWEVYGEGPGDQHDREITEGVMPIDTWRHGYALLEVIHARAEGARQRNYHKNKEVHRHGMAFRYIEQTPCRVCTKEVKREMGYICVEGSTCFTTCKTCFEIDIIRNKDLHRHGMTCKPSNHDRCGLCGVEPTNNAMGFTCVEGGRTCLTACVNCFQSDSLRNKDIHRHSMVCRYVDTYTCKVCKQHRFSEVCYVCVEGGTPCCAACRGCFAKGTSWSSDHMTDLQALICVNPDRIAVCFRGTDNIANVKTDCQMMRDIYPSMLGDASWHRELPKVHRGFLKAFQNICSEVTERLQPLLQENPETQLCITGHSLGGALAVLMAYHVKKNFQRDAMVYTFGSPRVGNASFSSIYDAAVPATFRVVNQSDVVATMPFALKGFLFKHTGREVCIDKKGNLIIEPTFIEKFIAPTKTLGLFKIGGSANILDHGLVRYAKSLSKIARYFDAPDLVIKMVPKKKPAWLVSRVGVPLDDELWSLVNLPGSFRPKGPKQNPLKVTYVSTDSEGS
eukprot:TRINITY_DN17946_c0_g1_i1.p1 TRINITY_DN17946_c0_g1~~TRINITY_DN17946_c0_g1_i1.p1  ORF type:complete len:1237 (+),score=163.75 TRINITY_DN17946_c0_g1_i1:82-3711(+)